MPAALEPHQCRVVLVGMMGSGKTTIGRLLGDLTGWPTYDNDETLIALYGMTPKQLLDERGEDEMRDAEDAALAFALSQPAPSIIDAAAGTIMSATSRAALQDPIVTWLRASPETLYARAGNAPHRPWLDLGEDWLRSIEEERRPLFASVADIVVDTDVREPADLAAEILNRLSEFCPAAAVPPRH